MELSEVRQHCLGAPRFCVEKDEIALLRRLLADSVGSGDGISPDD